MLEGLDKIRWDRLEHAYGSAQDVPELIKQLATAEGDPWENDDHPLRTLFTNIWHQCSTYEATAFAVPFLVELSASQSTPCRSEILMLLASIATGVPRLRPPGGSRRKESPHVNRARQEVVRHESIFVKLLHDGDVKVRAGAAHVLGSFPERASSYSAPLREAILHESNDLMRAGMLLCLGSLRDSSENSIQLLEQKFRSSAQRTEQTAAAIAIAWIRGAKAPDHVISFLEDATQSDWFNKCFYGLPWDIYAEIDAEEIMDRLNTPRESQLGMREIPDEEN